MKATTHTQMESVDIGATPKRAVRYPNTTPANPSFRSPTTRLNVPIDRLFSVSFSLYVCRRVKRPHKYSTPINRMKKGMA